jgi:hypothetical protein
LYPLFASLLLSVDIRLTGYNLLMQHQRTIPQGVEDIGMWQAILEFVSTCGIVTNAGLICFTMKVLPTQYVTSNDRIWIFIGFQVRTDIITYAPATDNQLIE